MLAYMVYEHVEFSKPVPISMLNTIPNNIYTIRSSVEHGFGDKFRKLNVLINHVCQHGSRVTPFKSFIIDS